jgi:hypothetical protein
VGEIRRFSARGMMICCRLGYVFMHAMVNRVLRIFCGFGMANGRGRGFSLVHRVCPSDESCLCSFWKTDNLLSADERVLFFQHLRRTKFYN